MSVFSAKPRGRPVYTSVIVSVPRILLTVTAAYAARFSAKSRLLVQATEDSAYALPAFKVDDTSLPHQSMLPQHFCSCHGLTNMPLQTYAAETTDAKIPAQRKSQDVWPHLQPTVLAPYDAPSSGAPREILVQRSVSTHVPTNGCSAAMAAFACTCY